MNNEKRTVWIDFQHQQYFVIPDEVVIPKGNKTLHNIIGQRRSVTADSITPWEVSAAEAQIHFQAGVTQLFEQAKEKYLPTIVSAASSEPTASTPLTISTLSSIFQNLADALSCAIAKDDAQLTAAHKHLHNARQQIVDIGIEIDPIVETLPPIVRSSYLESPNPAGFHRTVKWLQAIAEQLDQLQSEDTQDIVQVLARLNELTQTLFEKAETDEERRQRYHEMARQSLSAIPRPDISKILTK